MKAISAIASGVILILTGCGAGVDSTVDAVGMAEQANTASATSATDCAFRGELLFDFATFSGNGRTCLTCHSSSTGTVSPADAAARFQRNPYDPLFRTIDSDNGTGNAYTRLKAHATIRVVLPLTPRIKLADPAATKVVLFRGIPTTFNTPALDPVLMADGRAPSLTAQALDAIKSHLQPKSLPTASQLADIAAYEKTLFTSGDLEHFAKDHTDVPELPTGDTASEKRGRPFFLANGRCGMCHGGPFLNTETSFGFAPGSRFDDVGVSEMNDGNLPVQNFLLTYPEGSYIYPLSDPGRALTTNNPDDAGLFKIPTLWGIKRTAPYFHDNSAATLEATVDHYSRFFPLIGLPGLTVQEQADIVAYMKLL